MARAYRKRREQYIDVFESGFAFLTDKHFNKFLKLIQDELKSAILKQRFNWEPLSDTYAKWKKDNNLDNRTLIASGQYVDAIKVRTRKDGKHVGLPIRGTHKSEHYGKGQAEIKWGDLARLLEFGNSNMPPRPHWRPVQALAIKHFNQTKRELAKALRDRASQVFAGIKTGNLRLR